MIFGIHKKMIKDKIVFIYYEFISRLYYSNRYFYQYIPRNYYKKKAKSILKKSEPELYKIISRLNKIVAKSEYDALTLWGDAYFLFCQTLKQKPLKILECGSGISSVVFAYACKRLKENNNISSKIISFDENKEYLENMLIPIIPPNLLDFIDFKFSDLQLKEYRNAKFREIGISFKEIEIQHYDLIYIDAPQFKSGVYKNDNSFLKNKKLNKKPFDADLLNLLPSLSEKCMIIVDQRIDTVWKLKNFVGQLNNWKYHFLSKKTVFIFMGKYRAFQSEMI